jgi:predicted nucleic acid-binding protein
LSDPSFVIDASAAIAGLSPDEVNADAGVVVDRALANGCHAPAIWPFEVENILALKARRALIAAEDYARALRALRDFRATIDHQDIFASIAAARPLVQAHNLTIYDAVYLELATRLRLPLATLDRRLATAAAQVGAALLLAP